MTRGRFNLGLWVPSGFEIEAGQEKTWEVLTANLTWEGLVLVLGRSVVGKEVVPNDFDRFPVAGGGAAL